MASGATDPPGPLIGSGRAADVYEAGPDQVLRRYRTPFNVEPEARLMEHLHKTGFPVPRVYAADGGDLVMERLRGPDMLTDLARRPWLAARHGRTLGQLHERLHELPAPAGLRQAFSAGDPADNRILHLDLHPGNVMLTDRGPVVIDWSNVAAGPAGADVAMAWLLMQTSEVDALPLWMRTASGIVRSILIRRFRAAVSTDPGPFLRSVARARLNDRNVRPAEAARLRRLMRSQPGHTTVE
jgi:aminoglycoside phosphotransferase (APT) family kinase protein